VLLPSRQKRKFYVESELRRKVLINAVTVEVDLDARNFTGFRTYRDLCIDLDPNFTPLLVFAQFFLSFSLGIVVSMWANLL
jgi:hypothetical protein